MRWRPPSSRSTRTGAARQRRGHADHVRRGRARERFGPPVEIAGLFGEWPTLLHVEETAGQVVIAFPSRIRARIRIVALGESYDHVPLSDRMLRRLRLPRTVATGSGTVRACRRRAGIRVRFHAAARRRLRALERDEPWLLEVVVEARNAGGSARSTDKLGLDSRGRVTNVDD